MLHFISARLIAGVFLVLLLSACATLQTSALRSTPPSNLPERAELSNVVFYPQDDFQCGPSSLAMALQSSGVNVEPEQLRDSLYIPKRHGSLQIEMLSTARRFGMVAYVLQPDLQDVLGEVNNGNPVVVLQNLGLSWYPVWHFAVVIGYDLRKEELILRSGSEQRLVLPLSTFEHTWARSNYWAMVALPPDRIPSTAEPVAYIQSLTALHHSDPKLELTAVYTAAMQRWPNNLIVHIAAGNYAYTLGKLALAEQIFRVTTLAHPDSAAALNNLAQILSDLGKHDEALATINRALKLGGPMESTLRETLLEIEQKKLAVTK